MYCILRRKLTQIFKLLHIFTSSIFKVFINHSEIVLCGPQDRYVCAVTKDTLGNSVPCAVLRPSWVWLLNCLFSKNWSDLIHFHTFRPCPHFYFLSFLSPVFPLSGVVVTMECVEKLVRKDMSDPMTGDKLKEKDIIPLQRVRMRDIMP